ncbi:potassium voltage-gated channel subfamily G member 3 [Carlito syrichta]|uniref:Potassium voltage-gated channel subfamily G member 3 n=1 Tax=Carlito syrichta TaxID=1868482 RepID=A0A3Q0EEX1_CARSF|nr:potassium voltage-gated channel subfamily G member 3 [Carlito syrichta]
MGSLAGLVVFVRGCLGVIVGQSDAQDFSLIHPLVRNVNKLHPTWGSHKKLRYFGSQVLVLSGCCPGQGFLTGVLKFYFFSPGVCGARALGHSPQDGDGFFKNPTSMLCKYNSQCMQSYGKVGKYCCRIIEAICIGWFTAECIVRFIVSKNKCEFVKRPLNIIDLLAITPYYISVLMTVFTGENSQLQRAGVTLRVLRMMRIFWVIKLARHFIGLQTLGLTLKRCYREMVMLLVFICVAMAIFSALSQLLEHGLDLETSNKDFASIPAACWWVIISMTTVGYGDMYPITVPGRILGGVCVVSGIVLLALPITFIYHSFVQCYHELKFRSARCSRSLSAEFLN